MVIYKPSHYVDWMPERLKEEIKKLRELRDPLQRELTRVTLEIEANAAAIREVQFALLCNSGLREFLEN